MTEPFVTVFVLVIVAGVAWYVIQRRKRRKDAPKGSTGTGGSRGGGRNSDKV